jgi:hypothetical protein
MCGRRITDPPIVQFNQGGIMLKLKQMALAVTLALPMLANAQTNAELKSEIDLLKAQINELKSMMKQQAAAPAAASVGGGEAVDPAEFAAVRTKVDALVDDKEAAGFKGLRIYAGLDPTYIYNRAKNSSSFAFLNNSASINGSNEVFGYDNSTYGMAYVDFQKEMEGGTKLRLTLAPSKSTGSQYNFGNIVHEAYASIPLGGDPATRLMVGQIADISGYQPWLNTYVGANNIVSNQLFPGFGEYFITKNLLFDFTAATFFTGAGLDILRGSWEWKFIAGNFNSARNDVNACAANDGSVDPITTGTIACSPRPVRSPTFIYNAYYYINEFSGFEFTGYEGKVTNWVQGGASRLDSFEIDANYTRGDFNGNLQYTIGRQKEAAFNTTDGPRDSQWWGLSALASQRVTPALTLAARIDYLNNEKNGGGTINVGNLLPLPLDQNGALSVYTGDFYNGFGPGDPNAAGYDANKGANRTSLAFSATYRLTPNVAFRGEIRHDHATTPAFYFFNDQSFRKSNDVFGVQTVVNF